jgi:hypothetical protein
MPLDLGIISGYLTVLLARGARHLADHVLDGLLDRLAALLEKRIDLQALQSNPGAIETNRLAQSLAAAAQSDRAFASELEAVIRDLDRHGGRTIINQVNAEQNVQAFDQGIAVGGDLFVNAPDPNDWSNAPGWVKGTSFLGFAVAVLGMGIFFLKMFGGPPTSVPVGLVVFFFGFIMMGIGALGRMMSRRR